MSDDVYYWIIYNSALASQFWSKLWSLQGINKVCIPPMQKPYTPAPAPPSAFAARGGRETVSGPARPFAKAGKGSRAAAAAAAG